MIASEAEEASASLWLSLDFEPRGVCLLPRRVRFV